MDKYTIAARTRAKVLRLARSGITIRDLMRAMDWEKGRAGALLMRMYRNGELSRVRVQEEGKRPCYRYTPAVERTHSAAYKRNKVTGNLPQYANRYVNRAEKPKRLAKLFGGL